MRVALIHNPGAGEDDQLGVEGLQKLIRAAGHQVVHRSSHDPGWPAVLNEGIDAVAVAGGDGTVGSIAKKLIGRGVPIAPLPYGTANNIARTLDLTELTLQEIVAGWNLERQITFDAGVAHGPWGVRYFIEAFGVGLFARTLPAADDNATLERLDDADEKIRYALRMLQRRLRQCPAQPLALRVNGQDLSDEYVLCEAMNMEFVGPNLHLAPEIRAADGLLDLVLVTPDECRKLTEVLEDWEQGELEYPDLQRVRADRIELEWSGYEVHLDDEAWPDDKDVAPTRTRIEITVEREAVRFLGAAPG